MQLLRIATRESRLALWQAHHVADRLKKLHPHLEIKIIGMTTSGDQQLDTSLAKIGGKGLFTKEIESALLQQQADCAVHSLKDLPPSMTPQLTLAAILERATPFDIFLSERFKNIAALPPDAIIGTSSLRRQAQLLHAQPSFRVQLLRGNLDTRLNKLKMGLYDAIILAKAGIERLQITMPYMVPFTGEEMLPAAGQGALAVQCRSDDSATLQLLQPLQCQNTHDCVTAERAFIYTLQGNCQTPIGALATLRNETELQLVGMVAEPNGRTILKDMISGPRIHADQLGHSLAKRLLEQGAAHLLSLRSSLP